MTGADVVDWALRAVDIMAYCALGHVIAKFFMGEFK